MTDIQKYNPATTSKELEPDILASVRQWVVEDNNRYTKLKLPKGTKFAPDIRIVGTGKYVRMNYSISTVDGTTQIITLHKI